MRNILLLSVILLLGYYMYDRGYFTFPKPYPTERSLSEDQREYEEFDVSSYAAEKLDELIGRDKK